MDSSSTDHFDDQSASTDRPGPSSHTNLLCQNQPRKRHSLSYSIAQPRKGPYGPRSPYTHRRTSFNPQYQALAKQIRNTQNEYSLENYLSKRIASEQACDEKAPTLSADSDNPSTSKDIFQDINSVTEKSDSRNKGHTPLVFVIRNKNDMNSMEQDSTCSCKQTNKTTITVSSQNLNCTKHKTKKPIAATTGQGDVVDVKSSKDCIVVDSKEISNIKPQTNNSYSKIRFKDSEETIDSFGEVRIENLKDTPGKQLWKKKHKKHRHRDQGGSQSVSKSDKGDKVNRNLELGKFKSDSLSNKMGGLLSKDKAKVYSNIETVTNNPKQSTVRLDSELDKVHLKSDKVLSNQQSSKPLDDWQYGRMQPHVNPEKLETPTKKSLREMILDDALKMRPVSGQNIVFSKLKESAHQKNVVCDTSAEKAKIVSKGTDLKYIASSTEKKKMMMKTKDPKDVAVYSPENILATEQDCRLQISSTEQDSVLQMEVAPVNKSSKSKTSNYMYDEKQVKSLSKRLSLITEKFFDIDRDLDENDPQQMEKNAENIIPDMNINKLLETDTLVKESESVDLTTFDINDNNSTAVSLIQDIDLTVGNVSSAESPIPDIDLTVGNISSTESPIPDIDFTNSFVESLIEEIPVDRLPTIDVDSVCEIFGDGSVDYDTDTAIEEYLDICEDYGFLFSPQLSMESVNEQTEELQTMTSCPDSDECGTQQQNPLFSYNEEDPLAGSVNTSCSPDENMHLSDSVSKAIDEVLFANKRYFVEDLANKSQFTDVLPQTFPLGADNDDSPPILMPFDDYVTVQPEIMGRLTDEYFRKKSNAGRVKPYWEMKLGMRQKHARERELFQSAKAFIGDNINQKRRRKVKFKQGKGKKRKLNADLYNKVSDKKEELSSDAGIIPEANTLTDTVLSGYIMENPCRDEEVLESEYTDNLHQKETVINTNVHNECNNDKESMCVGMESVASLPEKQVSEIDTQTITESLQHGTEPTTSMERNPTNCSQNVIKDTFCSEEKTPLDKNVSMCKLSGNREDKSNGHSIEEMLKIYKQDTYRKKLRERKDIAKEKEGKRRGRPPKHNLNGNMDDQGKPIQPRKEQVNIDISEKIEGSEDDMKRYENTTHYKTKTKRSMDLDKKEAKLELIDIAKTTLINKKHGHHPNVSNISKDDGTQEKILSKTLNTSDVGPKTWKSLKNLDIVASCVNPPLKTTFKKINKTHGTQTCETSEEYWSCMDQPRRGKKRCGRSSIKGEKNQYTCRFCGLKVTSSKNLTIHREEAHPYRCLYCYLTFPDKKTSRDHYWTHFKTLYSCEPCDMKFSNQYTYRRHVLTGKHILNEKQHSETNNAVESIAEVEEEEPSATLDQTGESTVDEESSVVNLYQLLVQDHDGNSDPTDESHYIIEISNAENAVCRPFTQQNYEALSSNHIQIDDGSTDDAPSCSSIVQPNDTEYCEMNSSLDFAWLPQCKAECEQDFTGIVYSGNDDDKATWESIYTYLRSLVNTSYTDTSSIENSGYSDASSNLTTGYLDSNSNVEMGCSDASSNVTAVYTDTSSNVITICSNVNMGYSDTSSNMTTGYPVPSSNVDTEYDAAGVTVNKDAILNMSMTLNQDTHTLTLDSVDNIKIESYGSLADTYCGVNTGEGWGNDKRNDDADNGGHSDQNVTDGQTVPSENIVLKAVSMAGIPTCSKTNVCESVVNSSQAGECDKMVDVKDKQNSTGLVGAKDKPNSIGFMDYALYSQLYNNPIKIEFEATDDTDDGAQNLCTLADSFSMCSKYDRQM